MGSATTFFLQKRRRLKRKKMRKQKSPLILEKTIYYIVTHYKKIVENLSAAYISLPLMNSLYMRPLRNNTCAAHPR